MAPLSPQLAAAVVQRFGAARVLVAGDVMLDRYWFGEVSRISPEAPVPVVHVQRTEERPGGAANVARGVAALGAWSHLVSVVGDDEAGRVLARMLAEEHVEGLLHADPGFSTTVKLRVIGRQQQLLRIDFENTPHHEILASQLEAYLKLLADVDLVILSDYGKGGLAHIGQMIAAARAAGKPVLVDPKGDDYERHRGAADPQSQRIPPGGGQLAKRTRADRQGPGPARTPRTGGLAGDAQRGGHDPVPRRWSGP